MALAKFITGHTKDYTGKAARLVDSAYRHGVDVQAIPYEDRGSWAQNTQAKAGIIFDYLMEQNQPVMWIDADSLFVNRLDDWQIKCWMDGVDVCLPRANSRAYRTFYTGTAWFNNTSLSHELAAYWARCCKEAEPYEPDEWLLERARVLVQESGAIIRYGFMPCKWSWFPIQDKRRRYPIEREDAIITHEIGERGSLWLAGLTEKQRKELGLWDYSNSI